MKFVIIGKNIDVTEGLKNAVYEKIGKLEKYFTDYNIMQKKIPFEWVRTIKKTINRS